MLSKNVLVFQLTGNLAKLVVDKLFATLSVKAILNRSTCVTIQSSHF